MVGSAVRSPLHRWLAPILLSFVVGAVLLGVGVHGALRSTSRRPHAAAAPPTPAPPTPAPPAAALPLTARDWSHVRYPLECRPFPVRVLEHRYGDLTGDGRPEAAVVVVCDAGAGSPPHHLFVYDGASPAGAPRSLGELRAPRVEFVRDVSIGSGVVTATGLGYTGPTIPRCCPDVRSRVSWRWDGNGFGAARSASR